MKNRGKRQFVKRILSVAWVLAGLSPTLSAAQQNYPEKPIRVIVPFSPGGGADALGRELAKKMSEYLGVSVYVENLPGASTIIGTDRAAKAAPDGYTVLLTSTTTFGTNPHLIKSIPYTLDDFSGISLLAENPLVLAASTNTPFNTIGELVTFAKDAKHALTFGTQGQGGTSHLAGEMIKSELGIDMIDVPYKGSSPGLMDLVGNQLPLLVDGTVASLPLFKDGRIKILGVTSAHRLQAIPDVPTFAESGYPNLVTLFRFGLFAPKDISTDKVTKLNDAVKHAMSDQTFVDKFGAHGTLLKASEPEETIRIFKAEHATYGDVIKRAGLTSN